MIVNKVGPFNNPSETYQYYSLPYCKEGTGGVSKRQRHGLGELLVGDRKVVSPYEINFLDSFTWRSLCKVELTEEEVRVVGGRKRSERERERGTGMEGWGGDGGTPEARSRLSIMEPHLYLTHSSLTYRTETDVCGCDRG